nr:MobA/MobL family protein [Bradyrhizobium sp. 35]
MQKARLPGQTPREVAEYLRACEDQDRKNARVIDKVMLALPKELSQTERIKLVRDFAEYVTQGRAPWLAAFHDKGKDARNPHAHLVLRDRDPRTGKRVIGTSEKGSTEQLRESWEKFANQALERAGRSERIDRRTLAEQGVEREPTIHEGPRSQAMDKRGAKPKSRQRRVRNAPGAKRPERSVDYRRIDKGKSRPELNRQRRDAAQENERDYWAAIDRDNQGRELQDLAAIHNPHREPTEIRPDQPQFGRQPKRGPAASRRDLSAKPADKLAKQKPRSKNLGLDRSNGISQLQPAASRPPRQNHVGRPNGVRAANPQGVLAKPTDKFANQNPRSENPGLDRPDLTSPRQPTTSRPPLQTLVDRPKGGRAANPQDLTVKPADKLAKQPRFQDLGLDRFREPAAKGGQRNPVAASKPKLNARDQRALDRMKKERASDRSRDR